MYFSDREKKILMLLLEFQDGMTQSEIQTQLGVSKRTVYREIASIEKTIASLDLKVIKPRGSGYRLVGDSENIEVLRNLLTEQEEEIFTNVQRQSALAAMLLVAEEEMTIESLSIDFQVSPNTINSDLIAVEEGISDYQLKLLRLKARGILIDGEEKGRRQILSNLIYQGTNEYEFFQYLESLKEENILPGSSNFFIKLVEPKAWYLSQKVVLKDPNKIFSEVTDNQLQLLIINLAVSISRVYQGKFLRDEKENLIDRETHHLAKILLSVIDQEDIHFVKEEISFFGQQLEGLNYKVPQNIFLDSFDVELSYQVKELIRVTSEKLGIDFRKDETLFYDLVAHMSAAIKRVDHLKAKITNPLLAKIIDEYRPLFEAIQETMLKVFPDSGFSQDELAYIVIHFATAIERNPEIHPVSILVLCSSGIGTSKILESRLRRYIRSANEIKISRISQMSHLDFKEYDLILSTIFLPGFDLPYKIISPLLLDEELKDIKSFIHSEIMSTKGQNSSFSTKERADLEDAKGTFEDIYGTLKVANTILQRFNVKAIKTEKTLNQTISSIVKPLDGVLVTNVEKVTDELIRRYTIAPIGIPETQIALFHSSNRWIKDSYFGVYDLDRSFEIMGMDKKQMQLKRLLLMLAPEPMTIEHQNVLGKISSSIIDSDLNTQIYQEGNEKQIYQLLSSLFINEIKEIK